MKSTPRAAEIALLLQFIDEAYEKKAWHGPNLKGSIRGLNAKQALWQPAQGRHSIWEIVLHAAYWKYAVQRRLSGAKRGSFPRKGSNWFVGQSSKQKAAWKEDVALLDAMHRSLREAVAGLPRMDIHQKVPGSKTTYATMIYGIAAHDLYHAGQIQLLKRLQKTA